MNVPERPRILARAGVQAEQVKAKQRSAEELKQRIRDIAERTIMQLSLVSEKEFLQSDDLSILSQANKLLNDVEAKVVADPSTLSDEELAKRIK
jgi:hypothetical protein